MNTELKLRILCGGAFVPEGKSTFAGKPLYQTALLRLDANVRPAARADLGNGETAFLFGRVLGRRDASGRVTSCDPSVELSALGMQTVAAWTATHEGRYVVITAKGDACRVFADRFGKIDLYLQEGQRGVAIATDLSLLPESPGKSGFDQTALAHTLTYYGYRPPKQHTIYKSVRRLGVGEVAVFSGAFKIEAATFKPMRSASYVEADNDRYVDLFLDFLKAAGSPDGNVVYLSSGWDSTSILAGLVHLFGAKKVHPIIGRMTYSVRSGVCNRFELERAAKIADYYGLSLNTVEFDYFRNAPRWVDYTASFFKDHQFHTLTGINHTVLAEGVRAAGWADLPVFAGEISDGAHNLGFSQYATVFHPSFEFREYADKMSSYLFGPTFLQEIFAGRHSADAVYGFFRGRSGETIFDPPDTDNPTRRLFVDFFLRNGRRPFWSIANEPMLTQAGAEFYTETMADAYFTEAGRCEPDELYAWYLRLYNSFHWQGSTVATLQTTAARAGLDAHLPFWDGGIQDFLSAMPESWGRGLDFNSTKFPLKWMLKNRIDYPYHLQTGPHSYTYDVDPSFNHSEEYLCHSSVTASAQALMKERRYRDILSGEVFDLKYIDSLADDFANNQMTAGARLNGLMAVYLLCQTGWYE